MLYSSRGAHLELPLVHNNSIPYNFDGIKHILQQKTGAPSLPGTLSLYEPSRGLDSAKSVSDRLAIADAAHAKAITSPLAVICAPASCCFLVR
jgi:hypothetical protein